MGARATVGRLVAVALVASLLAPVTGGASAQPVEDAAGETFFLDSWGPVNQGFAGPASSEGVLLAGVEYDLTITGTYTVWNTNNYCGAWEPDAMFPSPGRTPRRVVFDAAFSFGYRSGNAICSQLPAPRYSVQMNVGDGWLNHEPFGGFPDGPDADHTYVYRVAGLGEPLQTRIVDHPITDNYGMMRISVARAELELPLSVDAGNDLTVVEGDQVVVSADVVGATSMQWSVVAASGPPVHLVGADSPAVAFAAVDDGEYRLRITATDGAGTASDEVTVTVLNAAPVVGAEAAPTTDDGLVAVTAAVTDAGILDRHAAQVEWGDGTVTPPTPATVQGAGWASVTLGHVYDEPGTYPITVTITDDDGGTTTSTTEVEVGGAGWPQPAPGIAIWGERTSGTGVRIEGGSHTIVGHTHSNAGLRIDGDGHHFAGPVSHAGELEVGGNSTTFDDPPEPTGPQPFPVTFDLEDYAPGGAVAEAVGDAFHDMTHVCGNAWTVRVPLAAGLYWVPCRVEVDGPAFAAGPVTIVSPQRIEISGGSKDIAVPFVDRLLALSDSTHQQAVSVSGESGTFGGHLVAPRGGIDVAGSGHEVQCGLLGRQVVVRGNGHTIDAARCGLSDPAGGLSDGTDLAAPPLLVPQLDLDVVAPTTVGPAASFDVTATATNVGATLVVPGLVVLANGSGTTLEITGAQYALERFDADQGWETVVTGPADGVDLRGEPVPIEGADYPVDGDRFAGTTVADGAAGMWSTAAVLDLDDTTVDLLLDPSRTVAVRSRLDLATDTTAVAVRQTTRFGGNVVEELRTATGTVADATASLAAADGLSGPDMLGDLLPAASASAVFSRPATADVARDDGEPEEVYRRRLLGLDGSTVAGVASAQGHSGIGQVWAAPRPTTTQVTLPVLRVEATDPAPVAPGEQATWPLRITNLGSAAAADVELSAALDDDALPDVGAVGPLAPGQQVMVDVPIDVAAETTVAIARLTASLTWTDADGAAYGPVDGLGRLRILHPAALSVTKTLLEPIPPSASFIPYRISVTNTGDEAQPGVVVVDEPDPRTSILPGTVSTSQGTVLVGNGSGDTHVEVAIGTIEPRATAWVDFVVDARPLPPGITEVTNQALVTADGLAPVLSDDPDQPGPADPTVVVIERDDPGDGSGGPGPGPVVSDPDGPVLADLSPPDGTTVSAPVQVSVSATPLDGREVVGWRVSAYRAGSDPADARTLASWPQPEAASFGPASADTDLADIEALFDPTVLSNGIWVLRVEVTDDTGATGRTESTLVVDGDLKLGRYVATYLDLEVGAGGFPLEVRRTYDTLESDLVGDFGHGWRLDVVGPSARANTALGLGPWSATSCSAGLIFVDLCWSSTEPRYVTVTWPDGRTETFDFTPRGNSFFPIAASVRFTPRAGTTSTLAPAGGGTTVGLNGNDGHFHTGLFGEGPVYDPARFELTDRHGTVYLLDRDTGLVSMTDRNGNSLLIDEDGITSSLGPSVGFVRDDLGRIEEAHGTDGRQLTYSYTEGGDLETVTDPNGNITTYHYEDHHLVGIDGPDSTRLSTLVYEDGRLVGVTDAAGNTTTVDVDVDARSETVTSPDGQLVTVSRFDDLGNLIERNELFDGRTLTSTFTYVAGTDLMATGTDPLGDTIELEWNDARDPIAVTDGEGRTTQFVYAEPDLLSEVVSPTGRTLLERQYDQAGNLVFERRAGDPDTDTTFSHSGGRLVSIAGPGDLSSTLTYDGAGRPTSITDAAGHQVTYTYDAAGRLQSVTDPSGASTSYGYDAVGNLTSVTNAKGHTRTFQYDGYDRPVLLEDETGATTELGYDDVGNLVERVDRTGTTTTNTFDSRGRIVRIEATDGTTTDLVHDPLGRPVRLANAHAAVEFEWDDASRVVGETALPADGAIPVTTLSYGYDRSGLLTEVVGPHGSTSYVFDDDALLAQVVSSAVGTFTLEHDAAGRLVVLERPNGTRDRISWTPFDAVESRTTTGPAGSELNQVEYTHSAAGQRTSMADADGDHTFSYDAAGRLATALRPTEGTLPDEHYGYDEVGNLVDWAGADANEVAHDEANRLLTDGIHDYEWDAEGRLSTRTERSTGVASDYRWNAAGLLTGITQPDGATTEHRYDPLGRRIATVQDGARSSYVWDGANVIAEYDDEGALAATHLVASEAGSVLATVGDEITYPLVDALGSVVAQTDASGALTARYRYDAYGRPTGVTGSQTYGFTGHGWDAGAGLHYARARWYEPAIGRFLSEDPLPAVNAYAYVGGDPLNLVDPTGRAAATEYSTLTSKKDGSRVAAGAAVRPPPFPPQLTTGWNARAGVNVYQGMRGGKPVYSGITTNLERRAAQHAARNFDRLRPIGEPVTRGQARAIEQALINKSRGENLINSISPKHPYFDDAVRWGEWWLRKAGFP